MPEDAAVAAAALRAGRDRAASDVRLWTWFLRCDALDVLLADAVRDFAALLRGYRGVDVATAGGAVPVDAAAATAALRAGWDRSASDARLWTGFLWRDARDVLLSGAVWDFAALLRWYRGVDVATAGGALPEDAAAAAAALRAGRDCAASDARLWTMFLRRDARDVLLAGAVWDFAVLLNVRRPLWE